MKKYIFDHLKENFKSYILIILFFISGIIMGSYTSVSYGSGVSGYMKEFFDSAGRILLTAPADSGAVFESTLSSSLKNILIIWILGFTVIGTAGTLFLILKSGFITGFTVCFLLDIYSFKGLPVAAASILFRCIFYFPLIFYISAESLKLSIILLKTVTGRIKYRTGIMNLILKYVAVLVISALLGVIYSLSEGYAGSVFITAIIRALM